MRDEQIRDTRTRDAMLLDAMRRQDDLEQAYRTMAQACVRMAEDRDRWRNRHGSCRLALAGAAGMAAVEALMLVWWWLR